MKFSRDDYNDLAALNQKIPVDEPVFLLRAKDVNAPDIVKRWAAKAEASGADRITVKSARQQAENMIAWQKENGSHIPDIPIDLKGIKAYQMNDADWVAALSRNAAIGFYLKNMEVEDTQERRDEFCDLASSDPWTIAQMQERIGTDEHNKKISMLEAVAALEVDQTPVIVWTSEL